MPTPATTAEGHVLSLLSLSDINSKQGCSHSPASTLVFTSQGMEACHKLILMEMGGGGEVQVLMLYLLALALCYLSLTFPCFCSVMAFPVLLLCFSSWSTCAKHSY